MMRFLWRSLTFSGALCSCSCGDGAHAVLDAKDADAAPDTDTDSDTDSNSDADGCVNTDTATDAGALCWIDEATGLEWQVYPPCADDGDDQFPWGDAVARCEGSELCGSTDWAMPNIGELRSLIRGCPETETGGACPIADGYTGIYGAECHGCAEHEGPSEEGLYWPSSFKGHPVLWSSSFRAEDRVYVCDFERARLYVEDPVGDVEHWPDAHSVRCVRHPDAIDAGLEVDALEQ